MVQGCGLVLSTTHGSPEEVRGATNRPVQGTPSSSGRGAPARASGPRMRPSPLKVAGKGGWAGIRDPITSPPADAPAVQKNEGPTHRPDPLREDPNPKDVHWLLGNTRVKTKSLAPPRGLWRAPARLSVAGINWRVGWILLQPHSTSSEQSDLKDPSALHSHSARQPAGESGNQRHFARGGLVGIRLRGLRRRPRRQTGPPSARDPGNPPTCRE